MKTLEVSTSGLAVEARYADSVDVVTLGVVVLFHPGIPQFSRPMALESVLRHWQKEVGAVTRSQEGLRSGLLLPGWRIMIEGVGPVTELRIAFRSSTEVEKEMAEDGVQDGTDRV